MKSALWAWIGVAAVGAGVAVLAYVGWRNSAELIPAMTDVSPDGNYRVEFYSVWTPSLLMAMPGQGSDAIDGFVRLKHKDGRLINEVFLIYLYGCEASWYDDSVALLGEGHVEWKLPK